MQRWRGSRGWGRECTILADMIEIQTNVGRSSKSELVGKGISYVVDLAQWWKFAMQGFSAEPRVNIRFRLGPAAARSQTFTDDQVGSQLQSIEAKIRLDARSQSDH